MPVNYNDKQLGSWVHTQRKLKKTGELEAARIKRLDELGFVWDPIGKYWDEMFSRLLAYQQQHGDCLVTLKYSDNQLGTWVRVQRTYQSKGKLDPAREQRLNGLGFSWDPISEQWEDMFGRLVAYQQQHGDCLVTEGYSDKQLNSWVKTQRLFKNRGKLEAARTKRLDELGFIWDPISKYWEDMFGRLVVYQQQHGDCLVPKGYSDKKLNSWVLTQRMSKKTGRLESAYEQRLNELGFSWDPISEQWEDMFGKLVAYKQQHGDCRVPHGYSDKQLATWLGTQRAFKKTGRLEAARIKRLDELGFVWDTVGKYWEEMFGRLAEYKQHHDDCMVPVSYSDKQLGSWVHTQRKLKKTGKLEAAREQRLNELGFVWNAWK